MDTQHENEILDLLERLGRKPGEGTPDLDGCSSDTLRQFARLARVNGAEDVLYDCAWIEHRRARWAACMVARYASVVAAGLTEEAAEIYRHLPAFARW